MNDNDFRELKAMVRETHDTVIRLETQWDGGPGHWPNCVVHTDKMDDHEKRMRYIESRVFKALGALAFITFLATVASVYSAFAK